MASVNLSSFVLRRKQGLCNVVAPTFQRPVEVASAASQRVSGGSGSFSCPHLPSVGMTGSSPTPRWKY